MNEFKEKLRAFILAENHDEIHSLLVEYEGCGGMQKEVYKILRTILFEIRDQIASGLDEKFEDAVLELMDFVWDNKIWNNRLTNEDVK